MLLPAPTLLQLTPAVLHQAAALLLHWPVLVLQALLLAQVSAVLLLLLLPALQLQKPRGCTYRQLLQHCLLLLHWHRLQQRCRLSRAGMCQRQH
jgi:hypothetical protein